MFLYLTEIFYPCIKYNLYIPNIHLYIFYFPLFGLRKRGGNVVGDKYGLVKITNKRFTLLPSAMKLGRVWIT